jgi:NADPH-dependent 2,4-dienoyl-CoA reductase/sulfur reductase-like enzyme
METYCNAQEQALAAAATLTGGSHEYRGLPYAWTDQFDLNIQVAGRTHADAEITVRGDQSTNSFSVLYQRLGVVEGIVAVNRPRDIAGGKRLIQQRWSGPSDALADPAIDLRKLTNRGQSGTPEPALASTSRASG